MQKDDGSCLLRPQVHVAEADAIREVRSLPGVIEAIERSHSRSWRGGFSDGDARKQSHHQAQRGERGAATDRS
jgi:hypothetical protein